MADFGSDGEGFRPPPRRATMPVGDLKRRLSSDIRSSRPPPSHLVPPRSTNDRSGIRHETEYDTDGDRHVNDARRMEIFEAAGVQYVKAPRPRERSYYQRARSPSPPAVSYSRYYDDDEVDVDVRRRVPAPPPVFLHGFESSDSEDDESRYDYIPSYGSAATIASEETEPSIDLATRSAALTDAAGSSTKAQVKIMHVHESHYLGDGYLGGLHKSKLVLLHEPGRLQQTLFRWVLTASEKKTVAKLIRDVERRGRKAKKTIAGTHQYIVPGLTKQNLRSDEMDKSSRSPVPSAYWINIPFFHLKEYSSNKQFSEPYSPALTLMQANFSQHPKARDMQQAVRVQGAPADHCFHISQLWAIAVENSLLVSCCTLSDELLLHDTQVKIKSLPPKGKLGENGKARILVSYYGNVLWAIPLQECQTWFTFIVHFWEFWPKNIRFYRHRKLLDADDWPDIVRLAGSQNGKVVVEAVLKPLPSAPVKGVLTPDEIEKNPKAANVNEAASNEATASIASVPDQNTFGSSKSPPQEPTTFSVFTWLVPDLGVSRTKTAQAELGHLDKFIRQHTQKKDKRSYTECPVATQEEIRSSLLNVTQSEVFGQLDDQSILRQALENRIDIFNAALLIFEFFLPLTFSGTMRPWPPLDGESSNIPEFTKIQKIADDNIPQVRRDFRDLCRQIQLFKQIMIHAQASDRARFNVPPQLFNAWIYLILATIQGSLDIGTYQSHMGNATILLEDGMRSILKTYSPHSLLEWSSILPTELLSQISLKLINDVAEEHLNITTVYSDYVDDLETIQRLITEIDVVIDVLKQQLNIFRGIIRHANPGYYYNSQEPIRHVTERIDYDSRRKPSFLGPERTDVAARERTRTRTRTQSREHYAQDKVDLYKSNYHYVQEAFSDDGYPREQGEGPKLSPTDRGGFRELLANECERVINQRLDDFGYFKMQANYLSQTNQNRAQTRKDYHDEAVYAFTIVTVIFLPLSTVASIFGMNTTDIRDIEFSQWLYWATAIPVTAVVILGGLWWMGELGNAALWVLNVRRPSAEDMGNFERSDTRSEYFGDYTPPPVRRRYSRRYVFRDQPGQIELEGLVREGEDVLEKAKFRRWHVNDPKVNNMT
ncbi:hypothetical protein CSUB01_03637 [Colletotrichum sublineola]|uniref:Mg2+ transporter n=1 Tax=Colletotrichum sublineola TaxID=1173701 RepID=A0A066XEH7_COLSU|nr:hypothetical protein CSUB01_03637 [Colletotrichum sublineola]